MAYGKIKSDALIYDNSGTDVEIAISTLPTAAQVAAKADTSAVTANTTAIAAKGDAFLGTAQTFTKAQRGDVIDVTGTTPSLDLNLGNNWRFTTSANWSSFTVSNLVEGQTGSIFIIYGGTHTGGFASQFKFVGGAAGIGNLTSTSGKIDRIDYIVLDSSTITCTITKDYVA